jgi:hypothetical protein
VPADDLKPIDIQHKGTFDRFFLQDPPEISELTFTNLFIWRHKYHPVWLEWEDCLLVIMSPEGRAPFGLPPVGTGDKVKALDVLVEQLRHMAPEVEIHRVSENFVRNYLDHDRYESVLDRDNSDYVYSCQDLITLSGRRYHRKKNHLNRFLNSRQFKYRKMDEQVAVDFLDMQEKWCQIRECVETPDLLSEDYAVREALTHFGQLGYQGGAIEINSDIEAFSLGEPLNSNTAVVHIEKANPEIQGLYGQ